MSSLLLSRILTVTLSRDESNDSSTGYDLKGYMFAQKAAEAITPKILGAALSIVSSATPL